MIYWSAESTSVPRRLPGDGLLLLVTPVNGSQVEC